MEKMGLYVYGIIQAMNENLLGMVTGIDGKHPLFAFGEGDFFAAVSLVNLDEYGEGKIDNLLEDMVWVEEKAKKHFDIQQHLFSLGVFIPIKFCTIYTEQIHLRQFLLSKSSELKEAFSYFFNKEEWTLKVYCDKKKFLEKNMEEERKLIYKQLDNTSKGVSYFMQKKLENILQEKAKDKLVKIRENIWNRLKMQVEEVALNKNLSKQVTERNEDMILNAALLVRRDHADALMNEYKAMEEMLKSSSSYVELTGPWPVYNFSALKIS